MDPARRATQRAPNLAFATQRDLLENVAVLGGYSALSLVFLFFFHWLMARYLGPTEYSVIGTFMSVLITAILVSGSFYLIITRFVTYHHSRSQYEEINYLVSNGLKYFFAAGFLIFLIFLVLSPQIAAFFNLDDIKPVVALGFAVWLQLLVPVYEAAFKGLEDVHSMGRMRLIENASRWIIAIVFAYLTFRLTAMIFALGLGTFVALAASFVAIRALQSRQLVRPNMREIWGYALPVFAVTASLAILLNLDLIMVKHYFPAQDAGIYAAASFVAKIPFLVSWTIATVLFPKVTKQFVDGLPTAHLLRRSVKWLTILVIAMTFLNIFFANAVFRYVFGPEYAFGSYLGVYSFAMGLLAIVNLLSVYQLARKRFTLAKIAPWFVLLQLFLIYHFHGSLFQVVTITVLVTSLLTATTIIVLRKELNFERIFQE
jgi:O-antigen/teichoic acid export membrane protein